MEQNTQLPYLPHDHPQSYWEFKNEKLFIKYDKSGNIISYGSYSITNKYLHLEWDGGITDQYQIVSLSDKSMWLRYSYGMGDYDGKKLEHHYEIVMEKY